VIEVKTESGSIYLFDDTAEEIARVYRIGNERMRGDYEWRNIIGGLPQIKIGEPVECTLEPLFEDEDPTFRWTTPVVEMEWVPANLNRNFSG
jgi:hypothetical protein